MARQQENVHITREVRFANPAAQSRAIHARHFPVGEQNVKRLTRNFRQSLEAIGGRVDEIAPFLQKVLQLLALDLRILSEQQSRQRIRRRMHLVDGTELLSERLQFDSIPSILNG